MATISVLMGIYNCASTLHEAIDSIIGQTYTDWELILCDDGSDDATYEIANTYRQRYPEKIVLLKNETNRGLNYTLNHCLKYATGKYIARMDGDDISLSQRFEKEIAALEKDSGLALVSTGMAYFDEHGDYASRSLCEYPEKDMLVHGPVHFHAPCIIRTDVIRSVGGYSDAQKFQRVEDWHLWLKIYASGGHGRNLQESLYKVRDDLNAARRRKFKYRLNEVYMSGLAVKQLHLPKWKYIFMLRPILVGLLPQSLYLYLHRKKIQA